MSLGIAPWALAVVACSLLVGALVQHTIGLGLGLVAAPVVSLVAPSLVPELLLWLALLMAVVTAVHERGGTDWRGLSWALPPRVVGTVVGVGVVALASDRAIGVVVGTMVLLTVLLTARALVVPVNRISLPVAGFVSGVSGTATSIGGPPLAILYQHHHPSVLRPTLAAYFVIGAALSLLGLGIAGQLEPDRALLALLLSPLLLVGAAVASWLRRRVPRAAIRNAVLVVCAASSVALILRSLV